MVVLVARPGALVTVSVVLVSGRAGAMITVSVVPARAGVTIT
ncbi:hypothetical protein [uncultured Thiodictyon sp.]|nr:hypothetical protein [uncultured Thiodictyon sp.]